MARFKYKTSDLGHIISQRYIIFNIKLKWKTNLCKVLSRLRRRRNLQSRFKIEGGEVRLLNDDEILAQIDSPEDILHT